jgi:hypothetical protein
LVVAVLCNATVNVGASVADGTACGAGLGSGAAVQPESKCKMQNAKLKMTTYDTRRLISGWRGVLKVDLL